MRDTRKILMTEKKLLAQLKNLKNLKPDSRWGKGNREILLSQISNGEEIKLSRFEIFKNILPVKQIEYATQPIGYFVMIAVAIFGVAVASIRAARNTTPGDSLYIAKIIAEKTEQAMTFDEKDKAKLGIEFAGNRTKEIAKVLAEPNTPGKSNTVEELSNDFKNEIQATQIRLNKIEPSTDGTQTAADNNDNNNQGSGDSQVFGADSAKSDNGLQTSDQKNSATSSVVVTATSTATTTATTTAPVDPQQALQEAEQLFDKKDFNGTLNKLNEASQLIDQPGTDSNSEAASSTQ